MKGDIVEALQVLKSALRNELPLRQPIEPLSAVDEQLLVEDSDVEDDEEGHTSSRAIDDCFLILFSDDDD